MVGTVSGGHRSIIDKLSNNSIPTYVNTAALQRSTAGCRDLSILMLKDALRIPCLVDELGLMNRSHSNGEFDILPEPLLKYLQTGAPWKTADVEAPMLHSSPTKSSQTLGDYNAKNQGIIHLGHKANTENSGSMQLGDVIGTLPNTPSTENIKLLEANELLVKRIVKLCKFYEANSKEEIDQLINNISQTHTDLSLKLPENLPSWSHAHEWQNNEQPTIENSVFANAYLSEKYNYQLFSFVAQNLNSPLKSRREHAQNILDLFANQVKHTANELIGDHFRQQMQGLCDMAHSMKATPDKQQEFISAFNEELGTNLTPESFEYKHQDQLKEIVGSLNFNQKNNPLEELILKCKVADDYPGSFETQVANLCKALEKEMSAEEDDFSRRFFIKQVNKDLQNLAATPLTFEDFSGSGSDKLKDALHLLKYDQQDHAMEKFLDKYTQGSGYYVNLYPFEVFKRNALIGTNLPADLDKNLYEKIVQNQDLSEEEAAEAVRVMSNNRRIDVDDSMLENKKALRKHFRSKVGCGYGYSNPEGLIDLPDYQLKPCLDMAYKANNQGIMEMFWQGKIMPVEELSQMLSKNGALEKYSNYLPTSITPVSTSQLTPPHSRVV